MSLLLPGTRPSASFNSSHGSLNHPFMTHVTLYNWRFVYVIIYFMSSSHYTVNFMRAQATSVLLMIESQHQVQRLTHDWGPKNIY